MKNILLFGLKNSGKTTIGKTLAKSLNYNFIDIDDLTETIYQEKNGSALSCKEIYKNFGELYFRALEKEAILSLSPNMHSIIALGGGTPLDISLHPFLQKLGVLFYLKISYEMFYSRNYANCQPDLLPLFVDKENPNNSLKKIYKERSKIYDLLSGRVIHTDNFSINEITKEIQNAIK